MEGVKNLDWDLAQSRFWLLTHAFRLQVGKIQNTIMKMDIVNSIIQVGISKTRNAASKTFIVISKIWTE